MKNIYELIKQGESSAVEFKGRNARAESIAREMVSFANTNGGVILFGVDDNGNIEGIDIKKPEEWISNIASHNVNPYIDHKITIQIIDGVKVAVINIEKGRHKPYQTVDGKFYLRVGSTNRIATKEQLSRLFQQAGLIHFDNSPVENSSFNDLDKIILHKYWSLYYQIDFLSMEQSEQINILLNSSILIEWENSVLCSVAGLLLFGKYPQQKILHASIIFAVFDGKDIDSPLNLKKEIEGTLTDQIEKTFSLIKTFLPNPSAIKGLKRIENNIVTDKALREIIVNSVLHRDYSIQSKKIHVYIFKDRLIFSSPGRIANSLTINHIRTGNSSPRNFLLLKFMDNMRYIDGLGRGIPMVIRELGNRVNFEEIGEDFRVTVFRNKK